MPTELVQLLDRLERRITALRSAHEELMSGLFRVAIRWDYAQDTGQDSHAVALVLASEVRAALDGMIGHLQTLKKLYQEPLR